MTSVLVYGAGGAQGSAIARAALAKGIRVRILLRHGAPDSFGAAVDIVRGDLADVARLRVANLGIDAAILTIPVAADGPTAVAFARNAIRAARVSGVTRIVLNTSGPVPAAPTGVEVLEARYAIEAELRASGIPFTIVRPTVYMGNLAAPWSAPAIVRDGVLAYPLPAAFPAAWMAWEDLAAVVVAAIQRPDCARRVLDVGGPQVLTGAALAEALSEAVGRNVTYIPVAPADFATGLNAALGGGLGDRIGALYAWMANAPVSPLALDAGPLLAELGVRPTSLAAWARMQDWAALARARAA